MFVGLGLYHWCSNNGYVGVNSSILPLLRDSNPLLDAAVAEIVDELAKYASQQGGSLTFLSGAEVMLTFRGREAMFSSIGKEATGIRNGFARAFDQWTPGDKISSLDDLGKFLQLLRGLVEAEGYLMRSFDSDVKVPTIDFAEFIRVSVNSDF